jgi:hypothetical protein
MPTPFTNFKKVGMVYLVTLVVITVFPGLTFASGKTSRRPASW